VELRNKNDCAGEGRHPFTRPDWLLTQRVIDEREQRVCSTSQSHPLVAGSPFQDTQTSGQNKNMVMSLERFETKNDCSRNDQEQFSEQDCTSVHINVTDIIKV
jgi:hypothetical protein